MAGPVSCLKPYWEFGVYIVINHHPNTMVRLWRAMQNAREAFRLLEKTMNH